MITNWLGLLENCHHASCLRAFARGLNVGSLVLPGTAFKALASLPSSGGQYFGGSRRSVCLGHRSRKNYSVGIIKSEFQE